MIEKHPESYYRIENRCWGTSDRRHVETNCKISLSVNEGEESKGLWEEKSHAHDLFWKSVSEAWVEKASSWLKWVLWRFWWSCLQWNRYGLIFSTDTHFNDIINNNRNGSDVIDSVFVDKLEVECKKTWKLFNKKKYWFRLCWSFWLQVYCYHKNRYIEGNMDTAHL